MASRQNAFYPEHVRGHSRAQCNAGYKLHLPDESFCIPREGERVCKPWYRIRCVRRLPPYASVAIRYALLALGVGRSVRRDEKQDDSSHRDGDEA